MTIASFADGTSSTFIVGETIPEIDVFKVWAISNGSISYTSIPLNYVDYTNGFNPDGTAQWGFTDHFGFHSRHPGGANFTWGDGRISWISDSIDLAAYRGLSTRAGGEVVSPP